MMMKSLIIIGGGGHAKVLIDSIKLSGFNIIGITDSDKSKHNLFLIDIPCLGGDHVILNYSPAEVMLVNGLGFSTNELKRHAVYDFYKNKGYSFASIIHPKTYIAQGVTLNEGVQVMVGAIIQIGCSIGANSIINTGAVIDHDCLVGENVHIGPGVTIAGGVKIGNSVFIGCGATLIHSLTVGECSTIGAGSVVIRDVLPKVTVVGIPAREV